MYGPRNNKLIQMFELNAYATSVLKIYCRLSSSQWPLFYRRSFSLSFFIYILRRFCFRCQCICRIFFITWVTAVGVVSSLWLKWKKVNEEKQNVWLGGMKCTESHKISYRLKIVHNWRREKNVCLANDDLLTVALENKHHIRRHILNHLAKFAFKWYRCISRNYKLITHRFVAKNHFGTTQKRLYIASSQWHFTAVWLIYFQSIFYTILFFSLFTIDIHFVSKQKNVNSVCGCVFKEREHYLL